MGPLTAEQLEQFNKNPRYVGLKFPDVSKPETLDKHYIGTLPRLALSFMKGTLKMDPAERLTAIQAL
jgi:cyclin-dependent kinase-like